MTDARPADIIDAHHHLWDLSAGSYGWLRTPPFKDRGWGDWSDLRRDYLISEFLADIAELPVRRSVHVQVSQDPAFALRETAWVSEIADEHGYPHAIVAFADLENPEADQALRAQKTFARVRGIRQVLNWHRDPRLSRAPMDHLASTTWRRNFALLGEMSLSFDAQVYPFQLCRLAELASSTGTTVVLDHCGLPAADLSDRDVWRAGIRELARVPGVHAKISGFGMTDGAVDRVVAVNAIAELIDTFGTDRVMFGSNFPVDRLRFTYAGLWEFFAGVLKDYPPAQQQAMLSGNASRFYRLALQRPAQALAAGEY